MKEFTAKQIHDDPTPVYQAALQGPVKISHKFHGNFVLMRADERHCLLGDVGPELHGDYGKPIIRSDGNILAPIGDNKFVVKSAGEVRGDRELAESVTVENETTMDYTVGGMIKSDKPYIVGERGPEAHGDQLIDVGVDVLDIVGNPKIRIIDKSSEKLRFNVTTMNHLEMDSIIVIEVGGDA